MVECFVEVEGTMQNKNVKKVSKLELEILELESRLAPTEADPFGGKGDEGLGKCDGRDIYCPQGAEC